MGGHSSPNSVYFYVCNLSLLHSSTPLPTTDRLPNGPGSAGAIATTGLILGKDPAERLNRLLAMSQRYVGDEVFVDVSTFMSERSTGHRNRAMAHLMLNFGMIDQPIDEALDICLICPLGDATLPKLTPRSKA